MTSQTEQITTVDAGAVRTELLSRLGLPADATDRDVETLHRAALSLVDNAPAAQRAWAVDHLAEIEAVQSLLAETDADEPGAAEAEAGEDGARPVRRSRAAWIVAALVLVVGGAFGVHLMTSNSGVPGIDGAPDTSTPSASASLDMAQVGALMQKISADPKDVKSYAALASLYFTAGDYKNSAQFSQKVTALEPKNVTGWIGLGAAQFNQGDAAGAEKSWLKAVAADPKNAEAHYDLGFLYMSGDKPDLAKTKAEWEKVVAIDPSSELAKTVKTHLASLASQTPSPAASK